MKDDEQVRIERIERVDEGFVEKFNSLLEKNIIWDEKITWDSREGDKFLSDSNNALFVGFFETEIVGFLTAHRLQRFDKKRAEVLIYDVGVHKDFRQKGIGRELINRVKLWAKEVGAEESWVIANRSNKAAMALYESMGGIIEDTDEQMFTFKL